MTSFDLIVIGAGALGSACAAELAAQEMSVGLIDPGGANASSIAAGMVAPAMETALDDLPETTARILKDARALWPDFAARHALELFQDGAEWRGRGCEVVADRLRARGFPVSRRGDAVFTEADARVHPGPALRRLRRRVANIEGVVKAVEGGDGDWRVVLDGGALVVARSLVVATGPAASLRGLATGVTNLIGRVQPIRGQIAFLAGETLPQVVRTAEGYAAPAEGGILIGASMEPGRRDLTPDVGAARDQVERVCAALDLHPGPLDVRVGVRGAFADGLPVAGKIDGVVVALAPRRNGWLLAPLIARLVADSVRGAPAGPHAAALGPLRPGLSAPAG